MITIEGLVAQARQDGASDIHIICGLPPKYRKDGQIENMCDEVLDEKECLRLARDLAGSDEAFKQLMRTASWTPPPPMRATAAVSTCSSSRGCRRWRCVCCARRSPT